MAKKQEKPKNWELKERFVDLDGTVYCKGVATGEKEEILPLGQAISEVKETQNEPSIEKELEVEEIEKPLDSEYKKELDKQSQEIAELKRLVRDLAKSSPVSGGTNADVLAEAFAKAQKIQNGGTAYYSNDDIDPDDWNEKGVEFVAHGLSYVITCDKRKGRSVKPPIEPIILFKFKSGRVVDKGTAKQKYLPFSGYKSHSNKEIQWLREHSQYNRKFHERASELENVTATSIEAAHKIGKFLDSKEPAQILSLAKAHGVSLGGDIGSISKRLHVVMTEKEIKTIEGNIAAKNKQKIEAMLFEK